MADPIKNSPLATSPSTSTENIAPAEEEKESHFVNVSGWGDFSKWGSSYSLLAYSLSPLKNGFSLGPVLSLTTQKFKDVAILGGLTGAFSPNDSHEIYIRALAGVGSVRDPSGSFQFQGIAGDYFAPTGDFDKPYINPECQYTYQGGESSITCGAYLYMPLAKGAVKPSIMLGGYGTFIPSGNIFGGGTILGLNFEMPIESK